jgi:hypothetical protein
MGLKSSALVIIPGAQKAGTTTLFDLLSRHPDLHIFSNEAGNAVKEPHFFSLDPDLACNHLSWYESLFGEEGIHLDASTSYWMSPHSIELAQELIGAAKHVVILRDPAERAYSGYLHMRKKDPPLECRSFEEIIDFIHQHRDEGIAAAENECVRRAIREKDVAPDYFDGEYLAEKASAPFTARFQDRLWPYKYVQYSLYSQRLSALFSENHDVSIIGMEQLVQTPTEVVNRLCKSIGVDPIGDIELPHRNATQVPTRFGRWYMQASRVLRSSSVVSAVLESDWIEKMKKTVRQATVFTDKRSIRKKLPPRTFSRLKELLSDEYQYWSNRSFAKHWDAPVSP